jgi:hypothetical protein
VIFTAAVAFLAYAWLVLWHASFVAGSFDSSGHINTARLILTGRIVEPVAALKLLDLPDGFLRAFLPLAFEPGPRPGTMVPFHPPGLPLHIAFSSLVAGWTYGPFIVSPLAALMSLFLIFLLGRELGLSRLICAAGAAMLALCPVFLFIAEQPMSDVVATMWSVAAILFALRSRRREGWAVAAGAAFGIAVLVRPADLLLVFPLALALAPRARSVLFFFLGGAPFAAALLSWNQVAFGSPFRAGNSSDLPVGLALADFPGRLRHYGLWLARMLSPLVLAGWALVVFARRVAWRDRVMLLAWFASFFLFSCFRAPDETWWHARFLLPAIPALVLGSLLAARDWLRPREGGGGGPVAFVLVTAAFAVVLASETYRVRDLGVLRFGEGEKVYAEASRWAETKIPPHSLMVSMEMSGALRYYTSLIPVRWDRIEPEQVPVLRERARTRGYQWFALLLPSENEELERRLPWGWTKVGTLRNATLWQPGSAR